MALTDEPFAQRDLIEVTGLHNLEVRTNPDDGFKVDITIYRADIQTLLTAEQVSLDDAYSKGYDEGGADEDETFEAGKDEATVEFRSELTDMLSRVASGMEDVVSELADLCRRSGVERPLIDRALLVGEDGPPNGA